MRLLLDTLACRVILDVSLVEWFLIDMNTVVTLNLTVLNWLFVLDPIYLTPPRALLVAESMTSRAFSIFESPPQPTSMTLVTLLVSFSIPGVFLLTTTGGRGCRMIVGMGMQLHEPMQALRNLILLASANVSPTNLVALCRSVT